MAVPTLEELTRYRWSSVDDADTFSVDNPATGKVMTVVQGAGAAQMNAAIETAHQAFVRDWRWRDRTERARLLLSCADVLEAHADELADLLSPENGKPVADARDNDVRFLIGVFRFFGSIVDKLPSGDFHDTGSIYSATVLEPFGVVGAIIPFSKDQQSKVLKYIEVGKREGARVVAEGRLPSDPTLAGGFFVPPTLLADVQPNARVAQGEIFGPVVTVTTFDTEADAIAIVNSSEYGLFPGLYTRDLDRALRVSRRIDVGVVLINNYFRGILGLPFGGTKHGGYGREHTIETLAHFGHRKLIRFPSGTGTWPQWRAVDEIFG